MVKLGSIVSIGAMALFTLGCSDSSGDDGGNAGAPGTGGGMSAGGTGGGGGSGGGGGTTGGGAPVINSVTWTPAAGCMAMTAGDFDVAVDATDPDGDTLTYSGMVTGCTGSIDGAAVTLNCPNFSPYPGSVTVSDGTNDTSLQFMLEPCTAGMAP